MSFESDPSQAVIQLLRLEAFAPYAGGEFSVRRGSERITLSLGESKPLGGHQAGLREKFSLLFVGRDDKPLQQGMHEFSHPELGEFELFITPVWSPAAAERWYEAIINRETMSEAPLQNPETRNQTENLT